MKSVLKKLIAAAGVAAVLVGVTRFTGTDAVIAAEEEKPADIIADYIARVQGGDIASVYEESFSVMVHNNLQSVYEDELKSVYGSLTSVQYKVITDTSDLREYALYSNNKRIANLRQVKKSDGTWATATVFDSMGTYVIEVESGKKPVVNGQTLTKNELLDTEVEATNLSGLGYTKADLLVDTYRVQNLIGKPVVTIDGENDSTYIIDVVNPNTIYVGTDLTDDEDLCDMVIQYAEICAMYPAQDVGLGAVANISMTDSNWYSRISEVQNDWFTAHYTPEFSNEKVLKLVQQGEDTMIANVVFDYYASNGQVSRTWVCGYQMTLVNVNGVWKIGGMGVDSTLNPHSDYYEAE